MSMKYLLLLAIIKLVARCFLYLGLSKRDLESFSRVILIQNPCFFDYWIAVTNLDYV